MSVTPADRQAYRKAVTACFDLILEGETADPRAAEKAVRAVTVAAMRVEGEERALLAALVMEHEESTDLCPYCGGPVHPRP